MFTMPTRRSVSTFAQIALLGIAVGPLALVAQQSSPSDPPAATQDQGAPPPPPHGHMDPAERQAHMLKMMTKRLDLNPDQVSQIKTIQADSQTQEQALRADNSQGPDRHAKMMDLHKSEMDKIRGVLNDDQRAKFDAMQAKRQERMHDHDGQQPPPPPAQQ